MQQTHRIKYLHYNNEPVVHFVQVACANSTFVLSVPAPSQLRMLSSRESCLRGGKNCPPPVQFVKDRKRHTKYSCITCGKSVCVRVECCFAAGTYIWVGSKQKRRLLPACSCCKVLGKTMSAAKTITLPMTSNQLLWKMKLWARSVPIYKHRTSLSVR